MDKVQLKVNSFLLKSKWIGGICLDNYMDTITKKCIGLDGAVVKSSANGLVGTGFTLYI